MVSVFSKKPKAPEHTVVEEVKIEDRSKAIRKKVDEMLQKQFDLT